MSSTAIQIALFPSMIIVPKSSKRHEQRKTNTALRNEAILLMFSELYKENRIRLDDVIEKIAARFILSIKTVERILSKKR